MSAYRFRSRLISWLSPYHHRILWSTVASLGILFAHPCIVAQRAFSASSSPSTSSETSPPASFSRSPTHPVLSSSSSSSPESSTTASFRTSSSTPTRSRWSWLRTCSPMTTPSVRTETRTIVTVIDSRSHDGNAVEASALPKPSSSLGVAPRRVQTVSVQGRRAYQEDAFVVWQPNTTPVSKESSVPSTAVLCEPNTPDVKETTSIDHDVHELLETYRPFLQGTFGVFDGHAGAACSEFLRLNAVRAIHAHVLETAVEVGIRPEDDDDRTGEAMEAALRDAILDLDAKFSEEARIRGLDDGSTAVVAHFFSPNKYVIAHTGDSRAVVIRHVPTLPRSESPSRGIEEKDKTSRSLSSYRHQVICLTNDHKPNHPVERSRIERTGGFVAYYGVWRTQGVLAMSRALGDISLKPFVVPDPDVRTYEVGSSDVCLLLATDGLWDVMDEEELAWFVEQHLKLSAGRWDGFASRLVEYAYEKGSTDNITVLVVEMHDRRPSAQVAQRNDNQYPRWRAKL